MSLLLDALKQAAMEMKESNEAIQSLAKDSPKDQENQQSNSSETEDNQTPDTIELDLELEEIDKEEDTTCVKETINSLGQEIDEEYKELSDDFKHLEKELDERHEKIVEKFHSDINKASYPLPEETTDSESVATNLSIEIDEDFQSILEDTQPPNTSQDQQTDHPIPTLNAEPNHPTPNTPTPNKEFEKRLEPNDLADDILEQYQPPPPDDSGAQSTPPSNTPQANTLSEEDIEAMVSGAFSASSSNEQVSDVKQSIANAKKSGDEGESNAEDSDEETCYSETLEELIKQSNKAVKNEKNGRRSAILFLILTAMSLGGFYYFYTITFAKKPTYNFQPLQPTELEVEPEIEEPLLEEPLVIEENKDIIDPLLAALEADDLDSGTFDNKSKPEEIIISTPTTEKPPKPSIPKAKPNPKVSTKKPVAKPKPKAKPKKKIPKKPIIKDNRSPIEKKLEQAYLAFHQDEYLRAKSLYEEVLALDEKNRDAFLGLGAVQTKLGNYDSAIKHYQQLLIIDPTDDVAQAGILQISLQLDSTHLETQLKLSIEKAPNSAFLKFVLGSVYANRNQWKEASIQFEEAVSIEPRSADFNYNLAVSYDQLGQALRALQYYMQALNLSWGQSINFSKEHVQQRIDQINSYSTNSDRGG